jgi:hypothetical protein
MTVSTQRLKKIIAVTACSFVAAVALGDSQGTSSVAAGSPAYASLEASLLPARPKTWQRPAPVTWSSRFNVRWEARWSGEGKYMV